MYSNSMITCQTFQEETRPRSHQLVQRVFLSRQQHRRWSPGAQVRPQVPNRNGSGQDLSSLVQQPELSEAVPLVGIQGAELPTWLSPERKFLSAINDNADTQDSHLQKGPGG